MANLRLYSALHRQGREPHEEDLAEVPMLFWLGLAAFLLVAFGIADYFHMGDYESQQVVAADMHSTARGE